MRRRVLVTGGAGFIGSALCRALLARDTEVLNLDALKLPGRAHALASLEGLAGHRFVEADIRDSRQVGALVAAFEPDAVAHLAAETHVDRSIDSAQAFVDSNIVGTFALLEAVRGWWRGLAQDRRDAFRFLHVSTDEVFGALGPTGAFSENSPYDPSSPYSASKAAADHLVSAWGRTYGLPIIISNCSNNYGPWQFPEKLIPLTILNGLHGQPLPVYGAGENVRDWLHVDDHAEGLIAALDRGQPGDRFCFGARAERRNIEVVRTICSALDAARPASAPHERLIRFVTDRPGHDFRYAIDPARAQAVLGWQPRRSFADGLESTVNWYLAHESWWRPIREQAYSGERLGLETNGRS